MPGTGSTTHRAPGRGENEGHELEPPHRAGRVPAGQARPAEPPSGRPARGGRARAPPHPGAAPPGGSPAGRPVGGLLHPAGAGPRAAPLPSGAGRASPGVDAHRGRARLPVPHGRRGAAAGAPAEPGDHPGHEAPARQHAGGPGLRARRGLQRAGLEPARDPLHRRPVPVRGQEHDPLDVPAGTAGRRLERCRLRPLHQVHGGRPARRLRSLPGRPRHRQPGHRDAGAVAAVRRDVGGARGRGARADAQARRSPAGRSPGVRVPGAAHRRDRPAPHRLLRRSRLGHRIRLRRTGRPSPAPGLTNPYRSGVLSPSRARPSHTPSPCPAARSPAATWGRTSAAGPSRRTARRIPASPA